MKRATLVCLLAVFVAGAPCFAKKARAPLPQKVLTAKTVLIENHGEAALADKAYDELKKWGRFQIVTEREKADLVLLVSAVPGEHTSGRTSTYDPNMKTGDMKTGGWKYGRVDADSPGSSSLAVLDAKTGDVLYSDTRVRQSFGSAIRGAIKGLRKRIEEQEKGTNGK